MMREGERWFCREEGKGVWTRWRSYLPQHTVAAYWSDATNKGGEREGGSGEGEGKGGTETNE